MEESTSEEFPAFDGITVAFERCPLCSTSRRPFTCQRCVEKGDFIHSSDVLGGVPERYAEKLHRYLRLKKERDQLCERLSEALESIKNKEEKELKLSRLSQRVGCMRQAVEEQNDYALNDRKSLDELIKKFKDKRSRSKIHLSKKERILKCIEQLKISLSILRCKLEEREDNLCEVRQLRIKQIASSLFPVSKVIISYDAEVSSSDSLQGQSLTSTLVEVEDEVGQEEELVVAALAEARRTSFIKGRWVYTDNGNETQYSIVHPKVRLPSNGDYSAYTQWVLREEDPLGNLDLHNDGHQTLAVLSFTTQLITHIAFFLGIPLPKKLHYSHFLVKQLELKEFSAAVEKLCVNILYLCSTQGANLDSINPQNPLGNILHLLASNSPLFGRTLPFEINPELFLAAMSPPSSATSLVSEASNFIPEELTESESSSDEYEEQEWETVPEADLSLIPSDTSVSTMSTAGSGPSTQEDKGDMSASNMSQVAGNLMSSAASSVASALWRVASRQYDKS